jgi:predicted nucleotidyltransferase component of viral defense system
MQLKAKIRNISREKRISAQVVLQNYMMERLLERVSNSLYKSSFILKGGMLISAMIGLESRTTMDIDATIRNHPLTVESIQRIFNEILALDINDGVSFRLKWINEIRENDLYSGFRISMDCFYDTLTVPIKVDLTSGDKITPHAIEYKYKLLMEERWISIYSYNLETILAEKIETILFRGILNTRSRDFYDIYKLSKLRGIGIDYSLCKKALIATMERRESINILSNSENIVDFIRRDRFIQERWAKYQREFNYVNEISFAEVMDEIKKVIFELIK